MKCYVVLTVELLFIQGALFVETDEENNSQYWKTRYLSGSDYGSQYNLNHDKSEKGIQNSDPHSRVLFSWGSVKNNSRSKSNENTHFFSQNNENLISNKAKNSRKDNIWWPWSNYEEWASSRKHNILANTNSTQSTTTTSSQNRKEKKKKKKGRKKKKTRKNKKFNLNSSTPSSSENIQPKNNFFMPNSLDNNPDNYSINQDISGNVRYESSTKSSRGQGLLISTAKPIYGDWDNNELDNEIRPRYNYYESIPLMNTKNIVLDKIKKHRNYDNFMKSYSSRNFTNENKTESTLT